jgi:hypothetical protein
MNGPLHEKTKIITQFAQFAQFAQLNRHKKENENNSWNQRRPRNACLTNNDLVLGHGYLTRSAAADKFLSSTPKSKCPTRLIMMSCVI